MRNIQHHGLLLSILLLSACSPQVPGNAVLQQAQVSISPDYKDLIIPCNIAPLNFKINEQAEDYITRIYSHKGEEIIVSGQKVKLNNKKWKRLLDKAGGDTIYTDVYLKKKGSWLKYPSLKNKVAEEIDPYISYRLIEPSYVGYEVMTINQRDMTDFKEKVIYNNYALSDGDNGQCVNCHSYQNYNRTENMQMHVRQHLGGTIVVTGDKIKKVNLKTPETISAGVYPSWHPKAMLIAYSNNDTGQSFHTKNLEKIEVQDTASDLILYDVEKDEVQIIANNKNELETFPYWSADGNSLYYVSATVRNMPAEEMNAYLKSNYKDIKYNIYRKPFDLATRKFGITDTLFMASDYGKSATFPRESPDGKYLLFTLGDYGTFHIWHKSSDLYLMDLNTRNIRPLTEINSPDVDSYHSWSSNGRWILFSTRRDDGSYTRLYISYFDKEGNAHKPFILPQEEPDYDLQLFKSYNIPEFMVKPIKTTHYELLKAIEKDAVNVKSNTLIFENLTKN